MILLQSFTTLLIAFFISRAYLRFRDKSLSLLEFFFWSFIWSCALILIFDPNVSNVIAKLVGLGRGADAIFLFSILVLFYLTFKLYVKIDSIDKNLTTLVIELSKEKHKFDKN